MFDSSFVTLYGHRLEVRSFVCNGGHVVSPKRTELRFFGDKLEV